MKFKRNDIVSVGKNIGQITDVHQQYTSNWPKTGSIIETFYYVHFVDDGSLWVNENKLIKPRLIKMN